ncbi:JmjC domain-containing histone demethylation protein 1 [Coprinopsis cinerea okayama7|uniref:JmjC domain-containing histone demethylation protein 1 n=1 Tax=Coprinopsis cinerea (strain Okayama-7 / 130 / ATCC MYA-4618 / FGSC 9003) TaxID=240176 RepID=A8NG85_COPC7|nr:JmjC domain-containing histone demethylation protein 1 [Coprinopsis cinerea okayama7\|eukprot:XP_001833506.2 JmjC domain-containing histone demethylation protein 1 [Coprinopsis cinerea okayama7\
MSATTNPSPNDPVPSPKRSPTPEKTIGTKPEEQTQEEGTKTPSETCPLCPDEKQERRRSSRREDWIQCEACNTWFHWKCTGDKTDLATIAKWFCKSCVEQDSSRVVTYKAPARKSLRKRAQQDYANIENGIGSDPRRWLKLLEDKDPYPDPFKRMKGSDVQLSWLEEDETAMLEPVVIEKPEGLGMKMPPSDFSVDDVADLLGEHTPVDVIDVASQSASPGWTLGKWADYVESEPSKREKIYNVISLEVSGTKIAEQVLPPKIVRDLDWVENFWPSTRKGKGNVYPKVQLYCLMGVETAWTDWHIDFAGSSVYYHILSGAKTFYFIRPTTANLAAYERWSGSELQYQTWLGDLVDHVYKVELKAGNTMIIPAGWIHAVYTPADTMVFGGNFLHSYNVATQIKVRNIEIATQVPKKFRFPMFARLCWYVGDKYLKDLRTHSEFPDRVMEGILALANFLVGEVRILERGGEQAKKEVKEQIPADRVKDAPALARELRWRTRLALGYSSCDEGDETVVNGAKRKRGASESPVNGIFRNFKPKKWDDSLEEVEQGENKRVKCGGPRPDSGEGWTKGWLKGETEEMGEETLVNIRKERYTKVRRTAHGVERQRVERTVEQWVLEE